MQATIEKVQTSTAKDDYDAKLSLIQRAFREISRLCFECNYSLSPDDWRVFDEGRLDDPGLSYSDLRGRLTQVYRRIQKACLEKGVRT